MKIYFSRFISKNYWILKKIPVINIIVRKYLHNNSIRNLALLNLIIAKTKFAEKYWVIGGLLLGWMREKDIIRGNEGDIDFAFNSLDEYLFLETIPLLYKAGFQPFTKWKNNASEITEYVLLKDGCKFEFFLMFEFNDKYRYFGYSKMKKSNSKISVFEAISEIEKHNLSKMTIFNIPFLVPENPQAWLTKRYGNWNVSGQKYNFIENEQTIVSREIWNGNNKWNE